MNHETIPSPIAAARLEIVTARFAILSGCPKIASGANPKAAVSNLSTPIKVKQTFFVSSSEKGEGGYEKEED